jgi:hypothetical protein
MGRQRNAVKTRTLKVSTTPQVIGYLQQLLKTGLYGKNPAEAAHILLTRTLDGMLSSGRLQAPRK